MAGAAGEFIADVVDRRPCMAALADFLFPGGNRSGQLLYYSF
jgi:hypothetical protein